MNKNSPLLILGAGSIGERHIRNLWNLGFRNLVVYRQRNFQFRDIGNAELKTFTSFKDALLCQPEAAFICTPTSQHMEQAISCIENNMHVFVEKPLSNNLELFDLLEKLVSGKNKILQVAFMMRFHPLIKRIKTIIETNVYGNLISMKSHWGSYLPEWHPWEDYKESYAAKKSLGGGVALTLCHDIDLAIWITGSELKTFNSQFQFSDTLNIETESIADFDLQFTNGIDAKVHLNYLDKPAIRNYHFQFEKAEVNIDYFNNTVKITPADPGTEPTIETISFERNQMYIDELIHFFDVIENTPDTKAYSLQQIRESALITKICTNESNNSN